MSDPEWQTIAELTSEADARIVLGLLESESIPSRIKSNVPVPGLSLSFKVQVQAGLTGRAEQVLRDAQVSDDELTQLAVSSPPPSDS